MQIHRHTFLLCVLTAFQVCSLFSQIRPPLNSKLNGLKVDNWQMEQGLPVNSIMTVAQTADGWMFFGTEEGLVRFDGNSFTVMNKSDIPGLNVNFISTLLGAHDTSLWIGTEGDGLLRYKNNSFIKYDKSTGLSDSRIFALLEDLQGGLWVGTSGGGLNYIRNGKISRYDTSSGLCCNYIRSVAMDAGGRIWVGTQKGISVIENGQVKNYSVRDGLSDNFIETLAVDRDQNLWIGTKSGGLNVLKQGKFYVYTTRDGLTSNSVTKLLFDRNGTLWIGTNGGGITLWDQGKFYPFTTKEGLSGDLVVTLFEDRSGNIWAGSSGTGIDRIKKKSIQTLNSRDGLPGDVILAVLEDHAGVLWFGVAGKGLNRLENGKIQSYTRKDGLPDDLVLSICEDPGHSLWIGTAGGGLTRFKDNRFKTYTTKDGLSNNVVVAIYFDKSGTLWAGTTGGGINRFYNGKFSSITTKEGLSNDNVDCILEDRKGNLWVGTNGGLNRIRDNSITVINKENGLSNDYILSLYEDPEGNLWVGTASNGLNLIRDGRITQYTVKDGLINEVVLKIMEDKFGYFWISCNKGIYKIKKQDLLDFADKKLKFLEPVAYGKSDGLETTECNGGVNPSGIEENNGKLLFPTMKGISLIDPKLMNIVSSDFCPVFIEQFLVDDQPVKMTPGLSVPSWSNRLEFRYSALNYANPGRISYRCMLLGFDKGWIDCGTRRSAYYTNIPSGDYVFKVMASNENGQWDNKACTEFKFRLKPPFFRSYTFYSIVGIFSLILVFFVSYYFIARYQRRRLKSLVEERTMELHQKMLAQIQAQEELQMTNSELLIAKEQAESASRLKTAFINNISHEIRTPLNTILGFSQLMAEPDLNQNEREQYFSIVKTSSNRLINTMTDFMDISLIASGNLVVGKKLFSSVALLEEIYDQFRQSKYAKKLELRLHKPAVEGKVFLNSDYELLRKVLHHLVDNAIKFTRQGTVDLGFEIKGNELEFFVKDTGLGISQEAQATIFDNFWQENLSDTRGHEGSGIGLSIVKGILQLLGGRIWLESTKGKGSSFYFTIPLDITDVETQVSTINRVNSDTRPLILIAEDETSGSLLLERILRKAGLDVLLVSNGQLAVEACRQNPVISIVLMDLKMPVMDGYEATKQIKAINPILPVIAITAYALSGDEKKSLEAGCDDYIAKPFEQETLLLKLRKFGVEIK